MIGGEGGGEGEGRDAIIIVVVVGGGGYLARIFTNDFSITDSLPGSRKTGTGPLRMFHICLC